MWTLCKGLTLCVVLVSCDSPGGTGENSGPIKNMTNGKWEYTAIADGGNDYIFLFDKNLELGDGTALLMDKKGNILKDFNEKKEFNNMVVAATFYENKSLLLSLSGKQLLLYEITTGNTYYSSVDEYKGNFLLQNQFFLLNESVALFVTARDYGGSDYTDKSLIAVNMKSGKKEVLAKNVGVTYKNGGNIYFTKHLKDIYMINGDVGTELISSIGKMVTGLSGNSSYSGYLTWENLSEQLDVLWQKNLKDYSDRIYEFGQINDIRYTMDYFFELVDNKMGEVVFRDGFPKDGYDIQSIKIISNTHVIFNLFLRSAPAKKRVLLLTISSKEYQYLPENRWLLDNTEQYLILDGDKLGIYSLYSNKLSEAVSSESVAEKYMNRGCCGFYYYVTPNTGMGCDFYVLDIENLTVEMIKHLSPQDLRN